LTSSAEAPFHASPDERLTRSRNAAPRAWTNLAVALLAATLLYAALFALLVYENGLEVVHAPEQEEIPIEIVVEPTPEPTPTPTPTPSPEPPKMAPPDDEKPAYDAPRAGNNDKRDDDNSADPNKPSAAPPPPAEVVPPPQPLPPVAVQAPPLPTAPDAEAPQMAKAEPAPPPDNPAPTPAPVTKAPMFASVPDVDFGGAALRAPIAGGNARATYLSILFGMITRRMHVPAAARTYSGKLEGIVVFSVDGQGRLVERWVRQSSGSPELDSAAMEAIAAAAPFPPPPRGGTASISFLYDGK
jgi:protein TonB